jgi:hypothetical protein
MEITQNKATKHIGIILLVCVLFCVAMNLLVWDYIQDDGYIAFHYADNLANHGTLYYNSDAQGPYGYSNPSYVFMLAAFRVLVLKQISFEALSRTIAVLSLGLIVFMLLKEIPPEIWKNGAGALFFLVGVCLTSILVFPYLLPNFFSGLETALFTLLLFVLMSFLFASAFNEKWFLLCLGLALTLRIDSVVLLVPIVVVYTLDPPNSFDRKRVKNVLIVFAITALFFSLHFIITGTFIPLSFGHKSHGFSQITFLNYIKFAAIVLLPFTVFLIGRDKNCFRFILFAVFYALYISLFYSFFMRWPFDRYVFPFLFSSFAVSLMLLLKTWKRSDWTNIAMLSVYMLFTFIPGTLQGFSWVSGYRVAMLNPKHIAHAFEQARIDDEFKTFACYDAGYIAYKTRWKIIDLQGLTTPEVTHQDIGRVVSDRNPTVLIVSTGEYVEPSAVKLVSQYQEKAAPVPSNYHFVTHLPLTNKYWWAGSQYSYYVFVNENAKPALINALRSIAIDVESEIGYQKYIFRLLELLSRLRF